MQYSTPRPVVETVYLLRHGQTAFNVAGRLRGRVDLELNVVGRAQAEALGELFTGVALSRVVSSPLKRALWTATPVARSAGLPVDPVADLNDRDYGRWSGGNRAEIEQRFGSLDAAPGVERWDTLCRRVARAFDALIAESRGPAIALVGHDATNRALLGTLISELENKPDDIPQDNGCWNRLELRDGHWKLVVLNARPGDGQCP